MSMSSVQLFQYCVEQMHLIAGFSGRRYHRLNRTRFISSTHCSARNSDEFDIADSDMTGADDCATELDWIIEQWREHSAQTQADRMPTSICLRKKMVFRLSWF